MSGRKHSADVYLRLKAAARQLVVAAGGAEAAATVCRLGHSQLSAFGSVNDPGRHMPVDVVADLEASVGEPVVSAVLAEIAGHHLAPIAGQSPCPRVAEALAKVFGGSGLLSAEYTMSMADQHLSPAERADLRRQLVEIMTAAAHAIAALEAGA